ncbi:MAG: hypothetical protein ACPGRX_00420 [Bdellovibrionales bacterium]
MTEEIVEHTTEELISIFATALARMDPIQKGKLARAREDFLQAFRTGGLSPTDRQLLVAEVAAAQEILSQPRLFEKQRSDGPSPKDITPKPPALERKD